MPQGCSNPRCAYADICDEYEDTDTYICTSKNKRCKNFYICVKCKNEGGHSQHAKWLQLCDKENYIT